MEYDFFLVVLISNRFDFVFNTNYYTEIIHLTFIT